ncbi:MAG: pirin family protein [Leptospiraceae bacterium]|nr:pirin family protein [Leptospiraceae bacterium]
MKAALHPAEERGKADFGWLNSHHSFSFGNYYNPEKIQFGALRVLNDDIVAPAMGFQTHSHANMEIISIPIYGTLAHKDSTGNQKNIESGEVQIMSAGTGISHSEFNASDKEPVNFLQIWILPEKMNVPPRYEQRFFDLEANRNKMVKIVSPDGSENSVQINQKAIFYQGLLDLDQTASLTLEKDFGLYVFLIDGSIKMDSQILQKRDSLAITEANSVAIKALENSRVLAIVVPLV